jgi:hypothetical protein
MWLDSEKMLNSIMDSCFQSSLKQFSIIKRPKLYDIRKQDTHAHTHTLTVFGFPSSPTAPISAPMVRGSVSEGQCADAEKE